MVILQNQVVAVRVVQLDHPSQVTCFEPGLENKGGVAIIFLDVKWFQTGVVFVCFPLLRVITVRVLAGQVGVTASLLLAGPALRLGLVVV